MSEMDDREATRFAYAAYRGSLNNPPTLPHWHDLHGHMQAAMVSVFRHSRDLVVPKAMIDEALRGSDNE